MTEDAQKNFKMSEKDMQAFQRMIENSVKDFMKVQEPKTPSQKESKTNKSCLNQSSSDESNFSFPKQELSHIANFGKHEVSGFDLSVAPILEDEPLNTEP